MSENFNKSDNNDFNKKSEDNWLHVQTDSTKKYSLFEKFTSDMDVQDFSNQDAHLLPQIKQVFEQTRLGKFKINLKAGKTYGLLEDFSW